MKTERTPLNKEQQLRLVNLFKINEPMESCDLVTVGCIKKFEIKYANHEESIYARDDDMDFVVNGITLERN